MIEGNAQGDEIDRLLMLSEPAAIKFVQAQHFTPGKRGVFDIDLIVIHCMDGVEKPNKAEEVALWFAGKGRDPAPKASAHYGIDNDSIVQMVLEKDIAWHAPGANRNGIGIEHAGLARQLRADWFDPFSRAMLLISSGLVARCCKHYGIPVQWVDAASLKTNTPGITTHAEVNNAWHKSTHTDPGRGFPLDWYLDQVRLAYAKI